MLINRVLVIVLAAACAASAVTVMSDDVTFDEFVLAPESHYGGAGSDVTTGFTSKGFYFEHTSDAYVWSGFSYSNETDTTTADHTNQFSAITGGGQESENYAVCSVALDWFGDYSAIPSVVQRTGSPVAVTGAYFTNTTYVALSMLNGNWACKKFGGATGEDEDWFLLTMTGKDAGGAVTGTVEFYLADYRFADDSEDYVVQDWTWVDMSALGVVSSIEFVLTGSDTGAYGMNTPGYFAMDTLVPEPMSLALLAVGGLLLRRRS